MKIQYYSDIHLEFDANRKYLRQEPFDITGDILILAGDIVPLHEAYFKDEFFDKISNCYKMVFWVPGNHEYYHKDLMEFASAMHIKIRDNVFIVNNISLEYNQIYFVFSTLWSKISQQNKKIVEQFVEDFNCILKNDKKLTAGDFNKLHAESLHFIKESLGKRPGLPSVVVTHHLPSSMCNSRKHRKSLINEAFCVDLTDYIEHCGANFWIYGHSHFNRKPLIIGSTILLTNQLGYLQYNENLDFKPGAYFVV
jgi:Icc-related predicted phosphoesterase